MTTEGAINLKSSEMAWLGVRFSFEIADTQDDVLVDTNIGEWLNDAVDRELGLRSCRVFA